MEALEELLGGPKDHTQIIKGKRTKRQRPQSPIPFSIATHNSSSGDGYGGSNIIGGENTNSSDEFLGSAATEEEEEEDMVANCLILLAQGPSSSKPVNYPDQENAGGFKFTSKRFLEAPSTGSGKVGMYVYQCKTCDRTFPSFQALGGHRASHKRPKPPPMVEVKRKMKFSSDDEGEEEGGGGGQIKNHLSSSLSLQLSNRPNLLPKSSPKVHECSICGAEFASGQALGGHMRRHRVSIGTNTTLSLSPLSPIGFESEDQEAKKHRTLSSLDLDLNLPAPIEDQVGESKYSFASEQQQQQQQQQSSLVLSTGPTLVDCHY